MNFPQQQPPGLFQFTAETEQRVHRVTHPILAGVGGVGMFFYGLNHPSLPLVLFVGLGVIGGFLATAILKQLADFLLGGALVAIAVLLAFWLFSNQDTLRREHAIPAAQTAPATKAHSWKDDLRGVL